MKNSFMHKRFMDILSTLYLCNLEEDHDNQKKKSCGDIYDPLFKVKPFMNELQEVCHTFFVTGQNVSIDERMVASKGRFGMKQYTKDNPTNWGFKLWVLVCSNTGYTYKFEVYTGKQLTHTVKGLGHDVFVEVNKWTI